MSSSENNDRGSPEKVWETYNTVNGLLKYNHSRWVENYKVFLTFNQFLLPALTALLAFSSRGCVITKIPIIVLCLVGAVAACCSIGLLKRIYVDTDVRVNQLRRLEKLMVDMPIKPYIEGYGFFFLQEALPSPEGTGDLFKLRGGGTRAIDAYTWVSKAIFIAYIVLLLYTVFV
ncbi:MAG TPA: hypothetical protein VEF33_11430 [Syntrophales bacterium]|nr:hypothetical protein [Syntrophales bacterium]